MGRVAAALALAAGFGLTACAASREAATRAANPPQGRFVTIDGTRLHVVVAGQGPDLVLIHGASGSGRDMTFDLVGRLSDRYRVIVPDRPGFGYSDALPGGGTLAQQADLLADLAVELGADRPLVVGHSYGGSVALAWAVQRPRNIAGLVTLAAASHPWQGDLPLFYRVTSSALGRAVAVPAIAALVPANTVNGMVEGVFAPQSEPEGYAAHFGPLMSASRKTLAANAQQRATLKDELAAMAPGYPALSLPVEVLHGDADTTVGLDIHSRPLSREVPGARLTVLPGVGHMPHHADPEAVVAVIDRAAACAGLR